MNHPQKVLTTCLVLLLFLLRTSAQVPPAIVITPVHGHFTLPNSAIESGHNLLWINTYTGDIQSLLSDARILETSRWSPTGEYLAYHQEYDGLNMLFDSQSGESQSIAALQDRTTIPIGWSHDGTNILYGDYRLDLTTYPYLPSYSFKIYNLATGIASTIAVLNFSQTLTGLPRPQGVGEFIVDIDTIYHIARNPVYDEWIAFTDVGLDATILPDGTFPGEYPPEEAVLYDVILWNMVTGQMFSTDALLTDKIDESQPIAWSTDGESLFVHAGLSVYILSLQEVSSEWQLGVVTSDEVTSESAIFWLGAGDLLISGDTDDETGDSIYYIAEIIKGQWYSTEFIRLSGEIYKGRSGDWRLDATDTEKLTLTCLFDQALPTRLSTGSQARVITPSLDVWAEPTFEGTPITQLSTGTEITIIGSTACFNAADYYRLWQVQLADSTIGWAAESDTIQYFLEPVTTSQPVSLTINVPPTDGTTLTTQDDTRFQAVAYDPAVGTNDGDGIQQVDFNVYDPSGKLIYANNELQAAYCAFGGDGPCDSAPAGLLDLPGTYTLKVRAETAGGTWTEWVSRTFVVDNPGG